MPRPKKEKPNHAGGLYEVKITIGKGVNGKLIRKSFYSSESKEDARKQAETWKIEREVAFRTGVGFTDKQKSFSEWADRWLETYKRPNVTENTYKGTYELYVEKHLKPYFRNADLSSIRPADIQHDASNAATWADAANAAAAVIDYKGGLSGLASDGVEYYSFSSNIFIFLQTVLFCS